MSSYSPPPIKIGGFGYGSKKIIINNQYLTSKFVINEKTPDELDELTSEYYNFTRGVHCVMGTLDRKKKTTCGCHHIITNRCTSTSHHAEAFLMPSSHKQ
jgi:hypothetical protein